LIILDEPTEHLDHETADQLIADLWEALAGAATLVITHDADLIERCDRQFALTHSATQVQEQPA
jgi:ABC-type transport system involved in cytochrome bd biosynthesis fused ATPase/permease subunit